MTDRASSPSRSLVVVTAGLGVPSSTRLLADRLAAATDRHLADAGIDARVEVVELRDHAQDLTNHLLTGFPSPKLQALFFDVVERDGLAGKPTLIAATGGTPRHSLAIEHAIRPLFAYLNAAVVATGVYAAAEDWGTGGVAADGGLVERIDRAADELAAAIAAREHQPVADPFADPVPFEGAALPARTRTEAGPRTRPDLAPPGSGAA